MVDDATARNRLFTYTAIRAVGLLIFFIGVAIMYTDLVRPGGWPQVGAIIALMGALDGMFAPHLLKKHWDETDAKGE